MDAEFVTRRFSEFGSDGGPAAKSLNPKFNLFVKQVSASIGTDAPRISVRTHWISSFPFSRIPSTLLPSTYSSCVPSSDPNGLSCVRLQIKTVIAATMFLKAFGGLLFIISSSFGAFLLVGTLRLCRPCGKPVLHLHNTMPSQT